MAGQPPPQDPRRRQPQQPPKIIIRKPGQPQPAPQEPPPPPPGEQSPAPPEGQMKGIKILHWTFSVQGLIFMGSALLLFIASLILVYIAVSNVGIGSNARAGLNLHDANQPELAIKELRDALSWDSQHHESRELLAKIYAEQDAHADAEKEYGNLIRMGYRKPSVYAGLAVTKLRRADREKDPAKAVEIAQEALEEFGKVAGVNGEIGAATATLFIALKTDNHAQLLEARALYEGALSKLDGSVQPARGSLIDLYAGYSLTLSSLGENYDAAIAHAQRAANFNPFWEAPQNNMYLTVAKLWWEDTPPPEEYETALKKAGPIVRDGKNRALNRKVYPKLAGPWQRMALAVSRAHMVKGEFEKYKALTDTVFYLRSEEVRMKQIRAGMMSRAFDPEQAELPTKNVLKFIVPAFEALAKEQTMKDAEGLRVRAIMWNNLGVAREYVTVKNKSFRKMYAQELGAFMKAVELDPNCFPAQVNLSIIYTRIAAKTHDRKQKEVYHQRAREALQKAIELGEKRKDDTEGQSRLSEAKGIVGK